MKKTLPWIITLAYAFGLMQLRHGVIEASTVSMLCDGDIGPWWCALRHAFIMIFATNHLGDLALAVAALAVLLRSGVLGLATLLLGTTALVLYTYEPGALAVVVGVLVVARGQVEGVAWNAATAGHANANYS